MEILYHSKVPYKLLFALQLVTGILLLYFFIDQFLKETYLGIFIFTGPLLGLALGISGLKESRIRVVRFKGQEKLLEIEKTSLFGNKLRKINAFEMTTELKRAFKAHNQKFSKRKLRLVVLESGNKVEEIKSNLFILNKKKIRQLYEDLKVVVKMVESHKVEGAVKVD